VKLVSFAISALVAFSFAFVASRVEAERPKEPVLTLRGHSSYVYCVSYSADGKYIVSTSGDKTASLWDATTGKRLLTFDLHTSMVETAVFRPDGRQVASADSEGCVRLWETKTGKQPFCLQGHERYVYGVAYSPSGELLASGGEDRVIQLWNTRTGEATRRLTGHQETILDLAFSPDGRRLASASCDETVRLWEVATGQCCLEFKGHTDRVSGVAYTRDGRRLVTCGGDGTTRLWDVATGEELKVLPGPDASNDCITMAISPDGKWVVVSRNRGSEETGKLPGGLCVWETETGKQRALVEGLPSEIFRLAFSPDGKRLAAACRDNTVQVWDVAQLLER
jgi:WD40 repeat protein